MEDVLKGSNKIIVAADGDSRIRWATYLAYLIKSKSVFLRESSVLIVKKSAHEAVDSLFLNRSVDISGCAVLIMGFGGGANIRFSRGFAKFYIEKNVARRPILIAGFNGVCDPGDPHPLLCRTGADVILANSPGDLFQFRDWFDTLGVPGQERLRLFCYIEKEGVDRKEYLSVERASTLVPLKVKKKRVVFFAQPTVPSTFKERLYILERLIDLARTNPTLDVLIKPRSKRYVNGVTHQEEYYYQDLMSYVSGRVPKNFSFSYLPVESLLEITDLCVTIGSTVAFNAIKRNIPTLIVSDFGIRRDYGNHHFAGSGYLGPLKAIATHPFSFSLREKWMRLNLSSNEEQTDSLVSFVDSLIDRSFMKDKKIAISDNAYETWGCDYIFNPTSRPNVGVFKRKLYGIPAYAQRFLSRFIGPIV